MKLQWIHNFFVKLKNEGCSFLCTILLIVLNACIVCLYVITQHVSPDWFSTAETDSRRFFVQGPSGKHGMHPTPCLITPALPIHSSQPPPSHLPILFGTHQSKSSSRIANASEGSTSPDDPEVEEFFAADWGHPPTPHSLSLFLSILHPLFPPKCFFSINRGSQLKLAFNFLPNPC